MKKRVLAGIMSVMMMTTTALPVSAQEGSTTVKATVDSTYILTVPAETSITYGAENTLLSGKLKVTGNVLPTEQVMVTASCGSLHNAVQNTDLTYALKDEQSVVFSSAMWSETELRGAAKEIGLKIYIAEDAWRQAKAGSYTGTITFNAEIETVCGN